MRKNNREASLDSLRGLGMILIMYGHFFLESKLTTYFYIFHVPLFFGISGYVFSGNKYDFTTFVKKKISSLVVPYFSLAVPVIISYLVFIEENASISNICKVLLMYCVQRRFTTMWFLACLIMLEFIFWGMLKFIDKIRIQKMVIREMVLFGGTIVVAWIFFSYERAIAWPLPWNIDLAFLSSPFFALGYIWRNERSKFLQIEKKKAIGIWTTVLVLGSCFGALSYIITKERFDLFYAHFGVVPLSYIAAMLCFISLRELFTYIPHLRYLEYIGKNTILYYALHQMTFKQFFVKYLGFTTKIQMMSALIITVIIITLLNELLIRSKFSFIVGRKYSDKLIL